MRLTDRLESAPRRLAARLRDELLTRKGRRRLRRRIASRFLLTGLAIAWTHPFVSDFWNGQIGSFIAGRVIVADTHAPVLRTAVVLVPVPEQSGTTLAAYAKIDPGDPVALPEQVEDAAVWLWPDVDGWFDGMHLAAGLPYRVEVRRPGCPTVQFSVRKFRLLSFQSRRLHLEVPACDAES